MREAPKNDFSMHIERAPDRVIVRMAGVIDEESELSGLAELDSPLLWLHLAGIRRINSFGVRAWIEAIRRIPGDSRVVLTHCSPSIIDQCNMVAGFTGQGEIESFYVPMLCERCDLERDEFYEVAQCQDLGGSLPETRCPNCGGFMEIDDLEEQYLLFLRES
ncbi:MAG: hypothetical protein AAGC55_24550 [Myxococcota bacterium]